MNKAVMVSQLVSKVGQVVIIIVELLKVFRLRLKELIGLLRSKMQHYRRKHKPSKHDQILHKLHELETKLMSVLDDLTAQVAAVKGTVASAVTLLDGLAAKIDALIAAGNSDPALQALSDDLKASTQSLADAVARDPRP